MNNIGREQQEMERKLITDWKTVIEQVNSELARLSSFHFSPISSAWDSIKDENVSQYASDCAEQIGVYAKQILDSETKQEYDIGSPKTYFATYIFLKYNECVLRDLVDTEVNDDADVKFLNCLCELNRALDSRIMDESHSSEKLFLSAAKLNFKVHDYAKAQEYAERSIKLEEQNGQDTELNIDLRFQKRCLLAFCYEYSFDPNDRQGLCGDKNGLIEAVQLMIGYRPEKLLAQNNAGVCAFRNIVDDSRNLDVKTIPDAYAIIEEIYNKDSDKCLAHLILNSYSRFTSEENKRAYVSTLVHILAHCFSEIHKWNVLGAMRLANDSIYFSRMAEILMRSLKMSDERFITCYSTVLLENEEYISAIDVMEQERDALANKWGSQSSNELAQVDFYIWYFSVIAKRYADEIVDLDLDRRIESYRNKFHEYTQTHPHDEEAKVYYELLSMKEMLMTRFNDLKRGFVDQESCTKLIEKWGVFSNCRPKKSVHKVIREEWENLSHAFHIFLSCYRYNNTGNDWYLFDMENSLLSLQGGEEIRVFKKKLDITNAKSQRRVGNIDDNKCHGCYEITWGQGSIIYVGPPQRNIHNIFVRLGIDYEAQYKYDKSEVLTNSGEVGQALARISNILFIYNGKNINFLRELCDRMEANGERTRFNIFFYDLSENGKSTTSLATTSILDAIIKEQLSIKKMENLRTAVQYCVLFSALEKCIYRVSRPLEALVISPIETAKTYSDQNFDEAFFLLRSDMGTLELPDGDVAAWQSNLNACFSHEDGKIKMKQIRPSFFHEVDASCIEFILLFEPLARTEMDRSRAVTRTAVYHFSDMRPNVSQRKIGHTFSNKCNDRDHDMGDVVYSSIQKLYENRHPRYPKIHGANCKKWGECCSFFYNDITNCGVAGRPTTFTDRYYLEFARVVYLYLGINIGSVEGDYAIVKVPGDAVTHVNKYIFCKFKSGSSIDSTKYCKELRLCIEDVTREHVNSETQDSQTHSGFESNLESANISADNATNEIKQLLQELIDEIEPYNAEIEGVDFESYTYVRLNARKTLSQHVYEQLKTIRARCSLRTSCSENFITKVTDAIKNIKMSRTDGISHIMAITDADKGWRASINIKLDQEIQNINQAIQSLQSLLFGV